MRDPSRIALFVILVLLVVALAANGPSFGIVSAPVLRALAVVALIVFIVRKGGLGCCAACEPRSGAEETT